MQMSIKTCAFDTFVWMDKAKNGILFSNSILMSFFLAISASTGLHEKSRGALDFWKSSPVRV